MVADPIHAAPRALMLQSQVTHRLRRRAAWWLGWALAVLMGGMALAQTPEEGAGAGRLVLIADVVGPIGPATARFVDNAIKTAQEREAEALVLRMNTPGGLVTSMRDIIASILGSPVPVIGYVAPPGAHAASAGTYILYATNVAAMAPGTNIGAATPVQVGGGGFPGLSPQKKETPADQKEGEEKGKDGESAKKAPTNAMEAKATNDAVALIQSLAELRGRNAEWAEQAVREAATLSATKAAEMHVIDFVAADLPALLDKADGRKVIAGSAERTLHTKGATVEQIERGFVTELLGVLSNPNVAFILMLIGIYGLIFELANPGSIGPGLLGVICLVLAFYALNQLPLDYAGLALVVLGIGFMVAEAVTPSFGAFGVAGLAAFVIGSIMLIDTDEPAFQLSWTVIASTAIVSGALLVLVLGYVWRSHRRPVEIGPQHLIGSHAEVLDWSGDEGHVWAEGERWSAYGKVSLSQGDTVRIKGLRGLTVEVAPLHRRTA